MDGCWKRTRLPASTERAVGAASPSTAPASSPESCSSTSPTCRSYVSSYSSAQEGGRRCDNRSKRLWIEEPTVQLQYHQHNRQFRPWESRPIPSYLVVLDPLENPVIVDSLRRLGKWQSSIAGQIPKHQFQLTFIHIHNHVL